MFDSLVFRFLISGGSVWVSLSSFPAEASRALLTSMFTIAFSLISAFSFSIVYHTESTLILESLWNRSMSMLSQFGLLLLR